MTTPLRLMINALHAKAGGGVTYLRNMLPLLADDARLETHLVIHRNQRELFEPIDERVRVHEEVFPSSFLTRILWEQLVVPFRAFALGARVTFSPANFGPLLAPRPVVLLRNTVEAAATETRPIMRLYWLALKFMTTASLLRCRRAIAVSGYARDVLASGAAAGAALQGKSQNLSQAMSGDQRMYQKTRLLAGVALAAVFMAGGAWAQATTPWSENWDSASYTAGQDPTNPITLGWEQ